MIYIEPLEMVVKVSGAGAEVATKNCGVGGKDRGDIDLALLAQGQSHTGEPLVEMGDDSLLLLVADELAEEPRDEVAKYNGLISLVVIRRRRNTGNVPEIALPLI